MLNVLTQSHEPFTEFWGCVSCGNAVDIEGDVSYDGGKTLVVPVPGKSRRCEGCDQFIHETCARHGCCYECSSCAECDQNAGENPVVVCAGTIYPPSYRLSGDKTELLCRRCFIERIGECLSAVGDPFHTPAAQHRAVEQAPTILALGLSALLPGLGYLERCEIVDAIQGPKAAA